MIENFEPQPYPLECSADEGENWALVVGWQKTGDGRLTPVVAARDGGLGAVAEMGMLRYRPFVGIPQRAVVEARPSSPVRAEPVTRAVRRPQSE